MKGSFPSSFVRSNLVIRGGMLLSTSIITVFGLYLLSSEKKTHVQEPGVGFHTPAETAHLLALCSQPALLHMMKEGWFFCTAAGQVMSASHQNNLKISFCGCFPERGLGSHKDVSPNLPFPEHRNYMEKGIGEFHYSLHPSCGAQSDMTLGRILLVDGRCRWEVHTQARLFRAFNRLRWSLHTLTCWWYTAFEPF